MDPKYQDMSLPELLKARQELLDKRGRYMAAAVNNGEPRGALDAVPEFRAMSGELGDCEYAIKQTLGQDVRLDDPDDVARRGVERNLLPVEQNQKPNGQFVRTVDGSEVRTYRHNEPVADGRCSMGMREVGAIIAGQYKNDLAGCENELAELRSLGGAADASGGILIPEELSNILTDYARNRSVLAQAGMLTVPMGSRSLTLARVESDPSAYVKVENSNATASDPTFGACILQPYTVTVFTKISDELLEDAADSSVFAQVLMGALAAKVDGLGIRGTGAGEPRGLRLDPGIHEVDGGGTFDLDKMVDGAADIVGSNHSDTDLAYIMSPAEWSAWQQTKTGDGVYYGGTGPDVWVRSRKYTTSNVLDTYAATAKSAAGAGALSEIYVGRFGLMVLGLRRAMNLRVTREGAALQAGQAWLLANCRVDFGVLDPSAFCTVYNV